MMVVFVFFIQLTLLSCASVKKRKFLYATTTVEFLAPSTFAVFLKKECVYFIPPPTFARVTTYNPRQFDCRETFTFENFVFSLNVVIGHPINKSLF